MNNQNTGRHLRPPRRSALFKEKTGYLGLVLALFASLLGGAVVASGITSEVYASVAADYTDYGYYTGDDGEGYTPSAPGIEDDFAPDTLEGEYYAPENGEPEFGTDDAEFDYDAHAPPADNGFDHDDDAASEDLEDGVLLSPALVSADGITVDLLASWDVTAPNPSPAGEQLLAYFVMNANDVEHGSAGTTSLNVVIDGVNAGFATWARGTVSNGGRTLTISFNEFQLATSERFGFGLIGDQNGLMGANIRVTNPAGETLATANLEPRPVTPGTQAWDVVLTRSPGHGGAIQAQSLAVGFNLTIDRTSPIPNGDLVFNFGFEDVNAESARVPAVTRFQPTGPIGTRRAFNIVGGLGDDYVIGGGNQISGYLTPIAGGWEIRIPQDGFNPFQYLARQGNAGSALDPNMRVFATINLGFNSGTIAQRFLNTVFFAGNVWGANWGGVAETNRGITTEVAGQNTINNRAAFSFIPDGGFSSLWDHRGHSPQRQAILWGMAGPWGPTASLQTQSAVTSTAAWAASDWLPWGSEVMSQAHTTGHSQVANCIAINPAHTPFQGRVIVAENFADGDGANTRLWATTAPVGNLQGVDCHTLGGWFEIPRTAVIAGQGLYNLPNPANITALRAIGRINLTISAMHYTRMASPQQAGWMTARGWWPRSADINDFYQVTGDWDHVVAATPGQLFPSTNSSRDILRGNYGFPRVVKSVSNQAPGLGEQVTMTIQAVNVSNAGSMAMAVYDQMDYRLEFVPGSVRVNGVAAPNPSVKGLEPL